MGKFNALLDALGIVGKEAKAVGNDAAKALEKVTSAETAVGLKGEARGEYLKALDEIYGDQAKRAAEMGFSPETSYHGTPITNKFEQFKTNPKGANKYLEGVYSTRSLNEADRYSEGTGNIYNLKMRGEHLNLDDTKKIDQVIKNLGLNIPQKFTKFKYNPEMENLNKLRLAIEHSGISSKNVDQVLRNKLMDLGYTGVETKNDLVKSTFKPEFIRDSQAAFDPRFKDSPLLMAGGLAGANILPTTEQQLNPFARLSDVAGAWETAKEKVSKPLAKSLNLSGNPQDEAAFNQILKTGLDPLNFLPGAAGLAAGAAQMFTPSDEERAKKEAEDEMRKRVLNQMAGQ